MHAYLLVSNSTDDQEKETARLLAPFSIHPLDITRISIKHAIGIDTVREIKRAVMLKPFKGKTKAVVIEDAHTLTSQAQNALLKTLEEPPDNTIILLLTTNADLLLPTILSRCQVIQLPTNNKQLTTDELSTLNSALSTLLEHEIGEKLILAETIGKDRETATAWLEKMILVTRQLLINEVVKISPNPPAGGSRYLNILRLLQRAHALLSTTNVNPRFTLETLFLSFSSNNSDTIQS